MLQSSAQSVVLVLVLVVGASVVGTSVVELTVALSGTVVLVSVDSAGPCGWPGPQARRAAPRVKVASAVGAGASCRGVPQKGQPDSVRRTWRWQRMHGFMFATVPGGQEMNNVCRCPERQVICLCREVEDAVAQGRGGRREGGAAAPQEAVGDAAELADGAGDDLAGELAQAVDDRHAEAEGDEVDHERPAVGLERGLGVGLQAGEGVADELAVGVPGGREDQTFAGELGEAHALAFGEAVGACEGDAQRGLQEVVGAEVGGHEVDRGDGELGGALADGDDAVLAAAGQEVEGGGRLGAREGPQGRAEQVEVGALAGREGDGGAAVFAAQLAEEGGRARELLAGEGGDAGAGGGEAEGSALALVEGCADLVGEPADALEQGRLREADRARGVGEVEAAGEGGEGVEEVAVEYRGSRWHIGAF